jgi:tRNA A-37 threonylcarbamoyl transferase component Bud32
MIEYITAFHKRTIPKEEIKIRFQFIDNSLIINNEKIEIEGISFISQVGAPGANAVVLKGKDMMLDRDVAVKVWLPRIDKKPIKDRFMDEIKKNARVDGHPNVVRVFSGGVHNKGLKNEYYYAVMELVEGETLHEWLKKSPEFHARFSVYKQIFSGALAYSHKNHIYHGDLHDKNILVNEFHETKVLDFGTSRFASSKQDSLNREKKLILETAKKIMHEENDLGLLDLNLAPLPPWYVREVIENLGELIHELHLLSSIINSDVFNFDDDDYSLRSKINRICLLLVEYPCFQINKIYDYFESNLKLQEMYLDVFTSYIISFCEQKIKNPESSIYHIFPDKTAFPECVKLYESWKEISIEKTLKEEVARN